MDSKKLFAVAIVAALLVGGLAGCRSRRPAAPSNPQAAQPAPQTVYPSYGPSQGPSSTARIPPPPNAPDDWTSGGSSSMAVPPAPVPEPYLSGSPDGMGEADPFPSARVAPAGGGAVVRTDPTPVIHDSARSSALLDNQIETLKGRIADIEDDLRAPEPAVEPQGGGGADGRAAALAQQLRNRISSEVVQNGNVVVVRLEDAFRSGSDQLKKDPALVATLLHTAEALQSAGARAVLVVGHTDADPIKKSKWSSNKALSEARAQRVAAELSRRGVPAGALEVVGEGASQPLVPHERTKADKARNRRVEVHVQF
jgi:flagellar motor protein MotB